MKLRDKDGNSGEVSEVQHEDVAGRSRGYLVGVCADGLWLTPSQALRFAAAIRKTAELVLKKRARRQRRGSRG